MSVVKSGLKNGMRRIKEGKMFTLLLIAVIVLFVISECISFIMVSISYDGYCDFRNNLLDILFGCAITIIGVNTLFICLTTKNWFITTTLALTYGFLELIRYSFICLSSPKLYIVIIKGLSTVISLISIALIVYLMI